jgi:hypothetical protein
MCILFKLIVLVVRLTVGIFCQYHSKIHLICGAAHDVKMSLQILNKAYWQHWQGCHWIQWDGAEEMIMLIQH